MRALLTRRTLLRKAAVAGAGIVLSGAGWIGVRGVQAGPAASIAPSSTRIGRNSAGAEVVRHDPPGVVQQIILEGSAPARLPRPLLDPYLEPGFPVQALHTGGTYSASVISVQVADIDGDLLLEILATGLATGPLYAWHHDGTIVAGWPVQQPGGASYPAVLEDLPTRRAVVSGSFGFATVGSESQVTVFSGNGAALPGWPLTIFPKFVSTPPSVADVDADQVDEIFLNENDDQIDAYRLDGSVLPGWPQYSPLGGQAWYTPAYADLDGDGTLEIVSTTQWVTGGPYLLAYHRDGTPVAGFPVNMPVSNMSGPVIGDIDGDGQLEIVAVATLTNVSVVVFSPSGTLLRTMPVAGSVSYVGPPALADLDGDRIPEIVVQTDDYLSVVRGNGAALPGWPVFLGDRWRGNSSPVVGEVDGDAQMEIVVTTQQPGSSEFGDVRVYKADGTMEPGFPKALNIGSGGVPAIADIDRDRRNEIIVLGDYWNGFEGYYDKVWAYDLGNGPHGRIEWGQFGGNAAHTGRYPFPANADAIGLYAPASSTFFIRNATNGGAASTTLPYGPPGSNWIPLTGDWDGDGVETIGLYDPVTSVFYLRNSNSSGPADLVVAYGPPAAGWVPFSGDWTGAGVDDIGLYNPVDGTFFLRNADAPGPADTVFSYGPGGAAWMPLAGDWDGDGITTIGLYNSATGTFYLRNTNTGGPADLTFAYGPAGTGWIPVVGDWDGDRTDTVGLYDPAFAVYYLRNSNSSGPATLTFDYGPPGAGWSPLAANWDGS